MATSMLPPFLQPQALAPGLLEGDSYFNAKFNHSGSLGSAHAIWWPSSEPMNDSTVILFVPGNPGLVSFYTEFLSEIHEKVPNLAILAHAHLGHTPATIDQNVFKDPASVTLDSQLKSAIEALDAITLVLKPKRVMVISHSMGAWLTLQVCQRKLACTKQRLR